MRSASQAEVVPDMDESSQAQTQSSHPDSIAETEDSSGGGKELFHLRITINLHENAPLYYELWRGGIPIVRIIAVAAQSSSGGE